MNEDAQDWISNYCERHLDIDPDSLVDAMRWAYADAVRQVSASYWKGYSELEGSPAHVHSIEKAIMERAK